MLVRARITNRERFAAYTARMPAAVAAAGGEYLVLGGAPGWLEGAADSVSFVVSRWSSREQARHFWDSDTYSEIRKLRQGCGDFEVILLDGLETADNGGDG